MSSSTAETYRSAANQHLERAFALQSSMEQRVINALTEAFHEATVELETLYNGRLTGLIVWEGFGYEDSVDRHQRVRDVLLERLNGDAKNVGVLFTYTPREMEAMRAA